MSFLKDIGGSGLFGLGGMAAAGGPSGPAKALGHLIDANPVGISNIANTVGKVANGIASAGGATPGYDAPPATMPNLTNYLQLTDPRVLKALGASFNPRSNTVDFQ